MYASLFDLDTNLLGELYQAGSLSNASAAMGKFPAARGSEWRQGSTDFGDPSIDAVRGVQRLAARCEGFTPCVRDVRMLGVEENNLKQALEDED